MDQRFGAAELARFLEFIGRDEIRARFQECLRQIQMGWDEFGSLLSAYLDQPIEFVLCGESLDAIKRNNVITLYHLLRHGIVPQAMTGIKLTFYSAGTAIAQGDSLGHFDINVDDLAVRVDPGPGALGAALHLTKISGGQAGNDPLWLDGILLTHIHADHSAGFPEIFERMCWSGLIHSQNKFVLGNQTCIHGNASFNCGPLLDPYKKRKVHALALEPGEGFKKNGIKFTATCAKHVEAVDGVHRLEDTCIGYRVDTQYGSIGITGDTEWHPRLIEDFAGVDLLIAYVTQEAERAGTRTQKDYGLTEPSRFHRQFLGETGVAALLKHLKPRFGAILTDFGDQLKTPGGDYDLIPQRLVSRLEQKVNIRALIKAAVPGMVVHLDGKNISYEYW